MTYFIFKEIKIKYWYNHFIGIKEIENIPKGFKYDKYLYCYYNEYEDDIRIVSVSLKELFKYLEETKDYIKETEWIERLIEYIKIYYSEIYLMIEVMNT